MPPLVGRPLAPIGSPSGESAEKKCVVDTPGTKMAKYVQLRPAANLGFSKH